MDLSQIRGCTDMAMKKWANDDYEIQMCSHVLRHPYSGSYIMFWTGYEPLKKSSWNCNHEDISPSHDGQVDYIL